MSRNQHWIALFFLMLLFAFSGTFILFCAVLAMGYPVVSLLLFVVGLTAFAGAFCSIHLMELYA